MAKKKETAITVADNTPQLPGSAELDKALLDKAVNELNEIYVARSLETACTIGEYILKAFFDNKVENFNKWGTKHQTFVELTQSEDMHISSSNLWYSVRILEQSKALPSDIAKSLPVTHHKMLIPLKSEKKKVALAKKAIDKNLTTRDFQAEVRKAREGERGPVSSGRPNLPAFAKGLKQLVQAVDTATSERVTKSSFEHFDIKSAKSLLSDVNKAMSKLQTLQNSITSQIESLSSK